MQSKKLLRFLKGGFSMATVNYSLRIDETDKLKAEKIFSELGLSLAAGLNIYLKAVIRRKMIPFDLAINDNAKGPTLYFKQKQSEREKSLKAIKGILAGYEVDLEKERHERILLSETSD
jgi:DNA-damage-inducible protein J